MMIAARVQAPKTSHFAEQQAVRTFLNALNSADNATDDLPETHDRIGVNRIS